MTTPILLQRWISRIGAQLFSEGSTELGRTTVLVYGVDVKYGQSGMLIRPGVKTVFVVFLYDTGGWDIFVHPVAPHSSRSTIEEAAVVLGVDGCAGLAAT